MKCAAYVCVFAAMIVVANAADDETCGRLKDFEFAAKPAANASIRDWIEMRWIANLPEDTLYQKECHHSGSEAAAKLCGWLLENSSWEFPGFLPMRILGCHGAKFSDHFEYSPMWIASIGLDPGTTDDRRMVLDVAIGGHKGDSVVRYSVFVGPKAEEENPLPPLFPAKDFLGVND